MYIGQIVNSPERFRKQIVDVGQSLQTEQKDAKAAERKVRELTVWLNNVEEAQIEVNGGLEAVHELKGEVERQKATTRGIETQQAVDDLHRQLLDAENVRGQMKGRVERAEGDAQHIERESEVDNMYC